MAEASVLHTYGTTIVPVTETALTSYTSPCKSPPSRPKRLQLHTHVLGKAPLPNRSSPNFIHISSEKPPFPSEAAPTSYTCPRNSIPSRPRLHPFHTHLLVKALSPDRDCSHFIHISSKSPRKSPPSRPKQPKVDANALTPNRIQTKQRDPPIDESL